MPPPHRSTWSRHYPIFRARFRFRHRTHPKALAERLTVLNIAQCGPDGWSLWNGDVIDMVDRPASLAGEPNAYAVYVVGA